MTRCSTTLCIHAKVKARKAADNARYKQDFRKAHLDTMDNAEKLGREVTLLAAAAAAAAAAAGSASNAVV